MELKVVRKLGKMNILDLVKLSDQYTDEDIERSAEHIVDSIIRMSYEETELYKMGYERAAEEAAQDAAGASL